MVRPLALFGLGLALVLAGSPVPGYAEAFILPGRNVHPARKSTVNLTVGQITSIEGSVEETTRRLFTITGEEEKQDNAESYSLEELGIEDSDLMFGISLERQWKYVTLRLDASYLRAEASANASRDFFIGVNEVTFEGQQYEYMVITEGTAYDAEINGGVIALKGQITPVTFNPGGFVEFTPWIHLGLFGMLGTFEVDAGPATGVLQYENPPRDYVENGSGEGNTGIVAPELGVGGEVTLNFNPSDKDPTLLRLQATYSIFEFSGSSDDLGIGSRNEKDLDVEYDAIELRILFETPISIEKSLVAGLEYRITTAEADSEAQDIPLDETLRRREKFDKHIELKMEIITAFLGIRW